jgi:3'-5' exoribonuclease
MNRLYGLVESYNEATHDTDSLTVINAAKERVTLRVDKGTVIEPRVLYAFDLEPMTYKDKDQWKVLAFTPFEKVELEVPTRLTILKDFYPTTPEDPQALVTRIETALESLHNPVIKKITHALYHEHKEAFYLYPAATKFHHAFIGGVAHHTASMLHLAEGFLEVYPYLNRDLLMAGILLHDLFKTEELSDYKHPEYGPVGRLIGHITLGAQAIYHTAKALDVFDTEERILLEHMVLSHHYYGSFGSPKKPNVPEALALHYIDTIDSKFVVLGEALEATDAGTFTAPLAILDRERFYKAKR